MAKRNEKEYDGASRMPASMEPKELDLVEALSEAAARESAHALALLGWLGDALTQDQLNDLARACGAGGRLANEERAPEALAVIEELINQGADPFCFKGEPGARDYEPSALEGLIRAKLWVYARAIVERSGEGGWALAKSAMERMDKNEAWRRCEPRSLTLAAESGHRGVAFALSCGRDPNELVNGQPWIFSASDGQSVLSLAQAGASLRATGKGELSLEQSFAQKSAGKERQSLLEALAAASASAVGQLAPSQEQAIKSLAQLAGDAVYAEMERVASLAEVSLASAKTESGETLLGLALLNGNWPLAADLMTLGGADPAAPSRYPGVPVGALALWATPGNAKFEKSMAKRQQECFALAFAGIDHQWRDEAGEGLLERASKAKVDNRTDGALSPGRWRESAAMALLREVPLDPQRPLWARLAKMGQSPALVAFAAAEREEPWELGAEGLLATLAVKVYDDSYGRQTFWGESALSGLTRGASSKKSSQLVTPSQWALAFEALWDLAAKQERANAEAPPNHRPAQKDTRAVGELSAVFGRLGALGNSSKEVSERARLLCDLALDGWEPRRGLGEARAEALIESFCVGVIARSREIAPELALDVLSRGTPAAARVADAMLKERPEIAELLDLSHPLLAKEPGEAVSSSALWASAQALREKRKPAPPPEPEATPPTSTRRL